VDEERTELAVGAERLRDARRELGGIVAGDAHVGGPLAAEDGVGRLARHLAERDRHAVILRAAAW
jgi:hypothetical protein